MKRFVNADLLFYLIFSLLIILPLSMLVTLYAYSPNFDIQNIIVWKYAASSHLFPYRDVFFPYGFMFYFKDVSFFWRGIYVVLSLLVWYVIYRTIRVLGYSTILSRILFLGFCFAIVSIAGFESSLRYLTPLALLCILYLIAIRKGVKKESAFIIGICLSLLFSLIPDQGLYSYLLVTILLWLYDLKGHKNFSYKRVFFLYSYEHCGIILGLLPFGIYLYLTHSLIPFITSLTQLSAIYEYAKTPYFHTITGLYSFITICTLLLSLWLLTDKLLQKIIDKKMIFFLSLILFQILLYQKSLMRNIDQVTLFLPLFLLLIIAMFLSKKYQQMYLYGIITFMIFLGMPHVLSLISTYEHVAFLPHSITHYYSSQRQKIIALDPEMKKVYTYLSRREGHVFSLPADPLLYVLFQQKPPYFFEIYDASARYSQNNLISYITDENVQYVIVNTGIGAIQDGVPDILRGASLYRYIFTHFREETRIGEYLILKKQQTTAIPAVVGKPLDMGFIPKIEGMYTASFIPSRREHFNSVASLNEYLSKNAVISKNLFLLIRSTSVVPKTTLTLSTKPQQKMIITFSSCSKTPCLIHLDNLPLFYSGRVIKQISADHVNSISLFTSSSPHFW